MSQKSYIKEDTKPKRIEAVVDLMFDTEVCIVDLIDWIARDYGHRYTRLIMDKQLEQIGYIRRGVT
jgi:hypothetical protein